MHYTKFYISIIEEECFKYTVVLPDASVETFCIPKKGGGKSVTVQGNNTFVYKELLTDAEDIIVFSRCTKTPVLNVSVTSLEEIKPNPEQDYANTTE